MNDQDSRQAVASAFGKVKVIGASPKPICDESVFSRLTRNGINAAVTGEGALTKVVANLDGGASAAVAVPKDAIVDAGEATEGYRRDDGGREHGEQK